MKGEGGCGGGNRGDETSGGRKVLKLECVGPRGGTGKPWERVKKGGEEENEVPGQGWVRRPGYAHHECRLVSWIPLLCGIPCGKGGKP